MVQASTSADTVSVYRPLKPEISRAASETSL